VFTSHSTQYRCLVPYRNYKVFQTNRLYRKTTDRGHIRMFWLREQ